MMHRLTVIIVLFVAEFAMPTMAQQPRSPARGANRVACNNSIQLTDPALLTAIAGYMGTIEAKELPILHLQRQGDTLFCHVSALIDTEDIRNNPPTAIIQVLGRETLLYTGNESVAHLTKVCQLQLIDKYATVLSVDQLRKRVGKPPGTHMDVGYDRGVLKVAVTGGKAQILNRNQAVSFPHLKYGN